MITIESLYEELRREVTQDRLKELSSGIILHYRNKNPGALLTYPPAKAKEAADKKGPALFALLMQCYHPDKFAHVRKSIEEAFAAKDIDVLLKLRETYLFEIGALAQPPSNYESGADSEAYGFAEDDFGYREGRFRDEVYDDADDEDEEDREGGAFNDEGSFVDALARAFFGGLDVSLTKSDLANLEGELELGDFDIRDLNGVEYCENIKVLDLSSNRIERIGRLGELYFLEKLFISSNRIEDISALRNLDNLVEIDLSFNLIESIDALVGLKKLRYVNVMGNPIADCNAIGEMSARGVLVVHDVNFAPSLKRSR